MRVAVRNVKPQTAIERYEQHYRSDHHQSQKCVRPDNLHLLFLKTHVPEIGRPPSPFLPLASMNVLPVVSRPGLRQCNTCTVCCVALPIPEGHLNMGAKPAGVPCSNLAGCGCGIYKDRPRACRDFFCTWLSDTSWPEAWRPDRSGLLCLREELAPGLIGAAAYEVAPGALRSRVADLILRALQATVSVLVVVDANRQRRCCVQRPGRPYRGRGLTAA